MYSTLYRSLYGVLVLIWRMFYGCRSIECTTTYRAFYIWTGGDAGRLYKPLNDNNNKSRQTVAMRLLHYVLQAQQAVAGRPV